MATRSKLGDFEIMSRLGSGSFGTVFKVRRYIDENLYVIKNVRIVELSFKEQSEAINEVQILAQLKSPFVVRYYDSFIEKDSLHIVMEFCNRGDLQNLIKKAKDKNVSGLKENVIWNISLQIMLGLHYLHKKHILHRDLKSANVFLMKDETKAHYLVKIGDLGVAKLMDTSTALANTIVGTPYYLSPELCADMPYRDKSDCWAFGVLVYECATLQHPFEARNQCALIMKIIEAQVKPPSASTISSELRNIILWLLQKDPNLRPSIKDILNERVVREKLQEHQFELPDELKDARVTDALSNPNFEAKEKIKKKGSSIQLLAQRNQEQPAKKPAPKQRENSRDQLRIGGENTSAANPSSPSSGAAHKGVRRTGSTTSNTELKSDANSGPAPQSLAVAGSGVGPRSNISNISSNNNANSNSAARLPTFRGGSPATTSSSGFGSGGSGAVDVPAVRGDRVRGPSFRTRVPSEKALSRYQLKAPAAAASSNARHGESKQNLSGEAQQYKRHLSSKDGDLDPDRDLDQQQPCQEEDDEDNYVPVSAYQQSMLDLNRTPRGGAGGANTKASANSAQPGADAKDTSEYEEDFEEYDGDNGWENEQMSNTNNANARGNPNDYPSSASKKYNGIAASDEKPLRRGSQDATIDRNVGLNGQWDDEDGDAGDDKASFAVPPHNNRSMRGINPTASVDSIAGDPFHDTDSSLPDQSHQHTSTMNGEADMWDPIWTQKRGLIDNAPSFRNRDISETVTMDIGAGMYREVEESDDRDERDDKAGRNDLDDEDEDGEYGNRNSDVSYDDAELGPLMELIDAAKNKAMTALGESLFWKVYDLCAKHMNVSDDEDAQESDANMQPFIKELENILFEEGSGSMDVACEVVFSVKVLLALESRYDAYMQNMHQNISADSKN